MNASKAPRAKSLPGWIGPLLLSALVIGAFSPVFRADFVDWDDLKTIAQNPTLNPATFDSIVRYWSPANPHMDLYVPVTYTLWGVLAMLSPRHAVAEGITLSPTLFHAVNVALHAASALLVLQILRRLVRQELAAFVGAALFVLHPVQAESVGWISGGKDVLSGTLALLALLIYLDVVERSQQPRPHGSRARLSYALATIAFVCAMLAKPQAVVVPLIAGVIDVMLLRRGFMAAFRSLALWFLLAIPIIIIGRVSQPAAVIDSPALFRPVVAADAVAFYLGKLVLPIQLAVDYGRSPGWLLAAPDRFWTWLVPLCVLLLCLRFSRRAPWALAALAIFIAAILPVVGLIPFDFQLHSTVADHYLYVAMLGPAVFVAFGVSRFSRQWQMALASVALVLGAITFAQCRHWSGTLALFEHAQEVNPTSLAASNQLGLYWSAHGQPDLAIACLDLACRAHPDIAFVHYNYADVLSKNGVLDRAMEQYQLAIELDKTNADYWANFGLTLAKANHPREALAALQRAVTLNPNHADAFMNAGIILENVGKREDARKAFEQVLRIDPDRQAVREHLAEMTGK